MTESDFWQLAYTQQWATEQDVHDATSLGLLTSDQYQTITGNPYVA
jgi:hypothetical protein